MSKQAKSKACFFYVAESMAQTKGVSSHLKIQIKRHIFLRQRSALEVDILLQVKQKNSSLLCSQFLDFS